MKNEFKAVCGVVLALAALVCAGRAGAEVVISMEPVGYTPRPVVWGQVSASASSERLAAAAERLAEAAGSGDNSRAETLLAGLYSGAAGKGASAPVYASSRPAAPAPAAPQAVKYAPVAKAALEDLEEGAGAAVSGDDEGGEAAVAGSEAAAGEAPVTAADESSAAEEKPKAKMWENLLGNSIGILFVLLLILLL